MIRLPVAGNHKYKETDNINSGQSSLEYHPLWVTLYTQSISRYASKYRLIGTFLNHGGHKIITFKDMSKR